MATDTKSIGRKSTLRPEPQDANAFFVRRFRVANGFFCMEVQEGRLLFIQGIELRLHVRLFELATPRAIDR